MKKPMEIYSKIGVSLMGICRIYGYPWLNKPIGKFLIGICNKMGLEMRTYKANLLNPTFGDVIKKKRWSIGSRRSSGFEPFGQNSVARCRRRNR